MNQTKEVFLIRHGEVYDKWVKRVRLSPDEFDKSRSGLVSDQGLKQAQLTGELLKSENIERIFSSSRERSIQTAEIIAKYCNVKSEINDITLEVNLEDFSAMSQEQMLEILYEKGLKLLDFLESLPEEKIVLSTHGNITNVILSLIMCKKDKDLFKKIFLSFFDIYVTCNCSLNKIYLNDGIWKIRTINSGIHLGGNFPT